jgi:hypothetical protein
MSDVTVLVLVLVIGLPIFVIVRYWYRRRQAGKLADDLLKDVLKQGCISALREGLSVTGLAAPVPPA